MDGWHVTELGTDAQPVRLYASHRQPSRCSGRRLACETSLEVRKGKRPVHGNATDVRASDRPAASTPATERERRHAGIRSVQPATEDRRRMDDVSRGGLEGRGAQFGAYRFHPSSQRRATEEELGRLCSRTLTPTKCRPPLRAPREPRALCRIPAARLVGSSTQRS